MRIKKAVIPCAGLGTRFLPATKAIPKEMIPVIDIPMIQYIVEEVVRSGIEDVILVTARNKDSIVDHFDYSFEVEHTLDKKGNSSLADVSRNIAKLCNVITIRQKNPLGLGHAVLCAEPIIGNEPFAVLLGDDLIDSSIPCTKQLIDQYEKHQASVVGVMQIPKEDTSKYGIVAGDSIDKKTIHVKNLVEKPDPKVSPSTLAIPGRYVLSPTIFKHIKNTKPGKGGEIQLTDALQLLATHEKLMAYEFDGKRFDTGDRIGLLDATLTFALRRNDMKDAVRELLKKHLNGNEL